MFFLDTTSCIAQASTWAINDEAFEVGMNSSDPLMPKAASRKLVR